ncbi:MAG: response regulator transcription factor [Chloroflexi bacterium]|nr:MAG: response regulator transcription factor [Chloroflexota bacterium]
MRSSSRQVPHILVVEDEHAIARFIEMELLHEGYKVTVVGDGISALLFIRQHAPDLIILDLMLPNIDGLEVCRRLRTAGPQQRLPVIILTAKDQVTERVLGLKTGADDYLTKPFSIEELLARIEALLRRCGYLGGDEEEWLHFATISINTATREVRSGNACVELTAKEYDLLEYLLRHPRQVLHRKQIYEAVWGYDFDGESNVLEVYIRYLRNKLDGQHLIQAVRGVGYVLKEN